MSHDTAAKSSTSGTVVQFVPYGTKFEQIDPASLSATLTLSMLVHRFWGPATGVAVTRTADGRIRYADASYANDNRAKFIRGLNGGGPVWIGVEAPADGAEKPKSKPKRGSVRYIELRDGDLPSIVDRAEQALVAANLGVYQRGA